MVKRFRSELDTDGSGYYFYYNKDNPDVDLTGSTDYGDYGVNCFKVANRFHAVRRQITIDLASGVAGRIAH
jgi:hypothetical protein